MNKETKRRYLEDLKAFDFVKGQKMEQSAEVKVEESEVEKLRREVEELKRLTGKTTEESSIKKEVYKRKLAETEEVAEKIYRKGCLEKPYEGDFDSFMSDKNNTLTFGHTKGGE